MCLTSNHCLDLIVAVKCRSRNALTLAYHHCIYSFWRKRKKKKTAANHPLTIKTCNEPSRWKTCLCPCAVKANYVRLFSDREHVNTSQRGSSHSPCVAFLFMSFNSISGLLSHWTVLAPDFFFSLSLSLSEVFAAAFQEMPQLKRKTHSWPRPPWHLPSWRRDFVGPRSWSGGCVCVCLSGEFKAMLTLSVQSPEDNWGSSRRDWNNCNLASVALFQCARPLRFTIGQRPLMFLKRMSLNTATRWRSG